MLPTVSTVFTAIRGQIGTTGLQINNTNFAGAYSQRRSGFLFSDNSNGAAAGNIRIGFGATPTTVYATYIVPQGATYPFEIGSGVTVWILGDAPAMDFTFQEYQR